MRHPLKRCEKILHITRNILRMKTYPFLVILSIKLRMKLNSIHASLITESANQ